MTKSFPRGQLREDRRKFAARSRVQLLFATGAVARASGQVGHRDGHGPLETSGPGRHQGAVPGRGALVIKVTGLRTPFVSVTRPSLRASTLCIHAGTHADAATGSVGSPVFTSTTYAFPNPTNENLYPRFFNTPNQRVINHKLAALEQGEAALVFGSGMAAITTLLFAHLKPGDHAVFQADLYGGTHQLASRELTRFGVAISFCRTAEEFAAALRDRTRLVYVESPSNPLLRCVDLAAVAQLARARGVLAVIDNTFATPINQNPLLLGFDAVIHSATKYLNG